MMRGDAPVGSALRLVAERCLELALQETTANDEVFPVVCGRELSELVAFMLTFAPQVAHRPLPT